MAEFPAVFLIELSWVDMDINELANEAEKLSKEIRESIMEHGVANHPKYGKIFAYEVIILHKKMNRISGPLHCISYN